MAVTTGWYCAIVIGGSMTGVTYCGSVMLLARIEERDVVAADVDLVGAGRDDDRR